MVNYKIDDYNPRIKNLERIGKRYKKAQQSEKYYFLEYKYSYIPAVKRDNKFFNLISLEYMDFNNSDNEKYVTASCNFLLNSNFSL